jgi:hypothetical protein
MMGLREYVALVGDCRKYAAFCLEMAGSAKTESDRMKYLDLAQAWLNLAVSQSSQNEGTERPSKTH